MHPGRRFGRLGRATLVLPVILGVLVMHVLMVCTDAGPGHHGGSATAVASTAHAVPGHDPAAHGGHDATSSVGPDATSPTAAVLTGVAGAAVALADAAGRVTGPTGVLGADHGATAMCLAVLVGLGLLLRSRRAAALVAVEAFLPRRPARVRAPMTLPPPGPPRLLTLCVLRT